MRAIWDHSTEVAGIARKICKQIPFIQEAELTLAALVHDIGQLTLFGLGQPFETAFLDLQRAGHYAVDIENMLCGATHATVGADLLAAWNFPAGMVAAVGNHHTPGHFRSTFADALYLAECASESNEDAPDPSKYSAVCERLGVSEAFLRQLNRQPDPEFAMLRFAGAA